MNVSLDGRTLCHATNIVENLDILFNNHNYYYDAHSLQFGTSLKQAKHATEKMIVSNGHDAVDGSSCSISVSNLCKSSRIFC